MTEPEVIDWRGLYSEGWGREITPEAFAHPAKFSRALIRKIYSEFLARGWLAAGDTVIDPFGGVALGGLDALAAGLHWKGVELEPRFVELGRGNIALWDKTYGGKLPAWGTAWLTQGDSRALRAVLESEWWAPSNAEAVITSPPFLETKGGRNPAETTRSGVGVDGERRGGRTRSGYGDTPGNLGNMDAAISSPPFLQTSGGAKASGAPGTPTADKALYERHAAGNGGVGAYGDDTANLGNLPIGDADAAVSSPPYAQSVNQHQGANDSKARGRRKAQAGHDMARALTRGGPNSQQNQPQVYGATAGQVGALKEGDIDAAISSPPYEGAAAHPSLGSANKPDWGKAGGDIVGRRGKSAEYGKAAGQLAAMPSGEADGAISSPPYAADTKHDHTHDARDDRRGKKQGRGSFRGQYGKAAGQLAAMPSGEADGAISSPPYANEELNDGQRRVQDRGKAIEQRRTYGAAVTSPPYEEQPGHVKPGIDWQKAKRAGDSGGQHHAPGAPILNPAYGETAGQLGTRKGGETFWTAARAIVTETYLALRPGGHAAWVVKGFVKGGKLQDFPGQWRRLCESVGFETVAEVRAWVVEDNGTQFAMPGTEHKRHVTERKSFFRRLAESKGAPRIDYETVWLMVKA